MQDATPMSLRGSGGRCFDEGTLTFGLKRAIFIISLLLSTCLLTCSAPIPSPFETFLILSLPPLHQWSPLSAEFDLRSPSFANVTSSGLPPFATPPCTSYPTHELASHLQYRTYNAPILD